jgi:hypothetical protein
MSTPNDPTGSHHDPLDVVIAGYLEQVEAGAVPNREALLTQHPELADRLRAFFADLDRLDRQAGELHLSGEATRDADDLESPGELPRVRYFGDYELLEVIARGGMGVVYKARQTSLNRVVALKMILHGQLATARDVARFRAEAEAAANLDHPNIVPIHEVGEHQGQHYYAMRFVDGVPLSRHPRGDVRGEVRQLATVARAVHYAHQRGILHRDLKPGNILVQAADRGAPAGSIPAAVPFITDFGLAKRLDTAGDLTASGEAPGTPRYMAPEQAAGRKDLTVAADVYSLGVVLYERLTGVTPFTSDHPLELYRQIREAEPPRPSAVCPGLDRDLETVCLRCLEKEPAKRYGSAQELAEDLERWLEGKPILARPVGSLGRLRRWCRRNPVVAGLLGAVAASLLAGTVTSIVFAVQANHRAEAERAARSRAEDAEGGLERALARSLVRPLNPNDGALGDPEVEALWELAGTANERLRLRFLEEAVQTERTSRQLRQRVDQALLAAVGLDPRRREEAEGVLLAGMRDPGKSLRHRAEIAWAVLELAGPGSLTQRASSEVFIQGWAAEEDWERQLVEELTGFAGSDRMVASDAARLLTQVLEKEVASNYPFGRVNWARALASVAMRLEPGEAAHVLMQALVKEPDSWARQHLAEGLASVAGRLEPAEAARVCGGAARLLTGAMKEEVSVGDRELLAQGLAALAGRLEPGEAARACDRAARLLSQALEQEKGGLNCKGLAESLATVAGWLEPAQEARVCGRATRLLAEALEKEATDSQHQYRLSEGLAAVAPRLEPAEASRLLVRALEKVKEPSTRLVLAESLAAAAGHLEPVEAARVCREAARLLAQALEEEQEDWQRARLAQGLAAVAGRLEPAEAARVCRGAARLLTQALEKEQRSWIPQALAEGLASVARRLEPGEAGRVCNRAARLLTETLEKEEKDWARSNPARDLASRNPSGFQGGSRPQDGYQSAEGLALVAGRLEPAEAARACATAAQAEMEALIREPNRDVRLLAADRLSKFIHLVDKETALPAARSVARQIASCPEWRPHNLDLPAILERILTDTSQLQVRRRALNIAAVTGTASQDPLLTSFLLRFPAHDPLPCRLATQDLVELLKMPTCVGQVRRVILDQLGNRYGRRFATHWDFVRYAQEQRLHLDFTTPPQRPDK